jgi:hypothetical protein
MHSVFISYRRGDSSANTGRLFADLESRLGRDQVFRDVDGLELGVDFVDALDSALAECEVMLVMIGLTWVTVTGDRGRRLDQEDDFVRIEVATALARKDVRVIPILVDGAKMPISEELPEDMRSLCRRHAFELSERHWGYDVGRHCQVN